MRFIARFSFLIFFIVLLVNIASRRFEAAPFNYLHCIMWLLISICASLLRILDEILIANEVHTDPIFNRNKAVIEAQKAAQKKESKWFR
jgi:hypothetical protein